MISSATSLKMDREKRGGWGVSSVSSFFLGGGGGEVGEVFFCVCFRIIFFLGGCWFGCCVVLGC